MGNLVTRGNTYYESLEYQNALDMYNDAILNNPNNYLAYLKKANCLFHLNRSNEALNVYNQCLKMNPKLISAVYNIGYVEYSFKNYSEALMKFTQALDLANKSNKLKDLEPLYYGKALCFFQQGDYKNALQLFEKSNELNKNDSLTLNNIGRCHLKLNDKIKAIEYFTQSFYYSKEKFYIAIYNKADCLYSIGKKYEAVDLCNKIINEFNDKFPHAYYGLGLYYNENGDKLKAIENFTKCLQYDNTNLNAYMKRGNCFFRLKRFTEAIECFESIISVTPNFLNGLALFNKGNCLRELNQIEEAIKFYSKAIEIYKLDSDYFYNRAFCENIVHKSKESLNDLDESIKIKPNWKAYFLKGNIQYKELKAPSSAIDSFNRCIENYPTFSNAYYMKGICLYDLKNFSDALFSITKAIELSNIDKNKNPIPIEKLYYYKGLILKSLNQYDEALKEFDVALSKNIKYSECYYEKGSVMFIQKDYNNCISNLDQAIQLEPTFHAAYCKKGLCYKEMNDLENALKNFDKAISLNNKIGRYHFYKGITLYELKRKNNAMYSFDKSISYKYNITESYCYKAKCLFELNYKEESNKNLNYCLNCIFKKYNKNPDNKCDDKFFEEISINSIQNIHKDILGEVYFYQGLIEFNKNNFEDALEKYDLSIKFNPNYSSTYYNKAMCLVSLNKLNEAIENLNLTIKLNPTHHLVYFKKGNVLYKMNKKIDAMRCFQTSFELDKTDINAINNKGVCLYDMGEYEKALECYDVALKINPRYEMALKNKAKCLKDMKRINEGKIDNEEEEEMINNYLI